MFKSIVSKVASVIATRPPNPPPSPTTSTSSEDVFYPGRLCFSISTASSGKSSSIGSLRIITREEIYWSASEFEDFYFGDESDLNNLSTVEESEDTSIVFPHYFGSNAFGRLRVYHVAPYMMVGLFVGQTFVDVWWNGLIADELFLASPQRDMDVD
jgi:hypothetical protein